MSTVVLRTVARVVVPLGIVVSFAFFLQGHDLPGGGFVAGVLTASAVALAYLAYGVEGVEVDVLGRDVRPVGEAADRVVVGDYQSLTAVGLGLVAAVGVAAIVYGVLAGTPIPFLTQAHVEIALPLYGHVELASATVFDLGVYAVVVGALLTTLAVVGGE